MVKGLTATQRVVPYIPCVKGMSWDDKDWGWKGPWNWERAPWYDWDWDEWDWEEDWKEKSLDKRLDEEEEEKEKSTWRTGASDAAPLSKKRNNKNRPAGSGTVSHKRRLAFQQRSYEKRIAREQAEAEEEEKKIKEEEEERKLKEEEDKKKKEEDDKKKKEEDEKEKHANEKAKEKPGVKEEDKKEEKTTLAQRVAAKKEILDERIGPKGVQEVDISSSGESMSDEVSSSEDSLDCRESRDQQKGRGQTPKLELGPSKLEMVKEEGKRNKTAATKKPEEKASSSSSRGPAAMDTSLDQREEPASKSLDHREEPASKLLDKRNLPEIAIDHHNVLEIKGYIYPQSIRSLQQLKDLGYKVHLVSYCGEERWGDVYCEAKGAWDGWESLIRTEKRCGPKGKAEYLVRNGISVLVDDTAEILQEALLKGIKVYPITTKYEKHQWNMFNKPKGTPFCHRYLSDAINHIVMDMKKEKKEWQQKEK